MMNTNSDRFFDDLETVIYGCHAASRERIRGVFEDAGLYTFTFAEYFLDEPVTKSAVTKPFLNKRRIFFPFLPWAASLLLFRLSTKERGKGNRKSIETSFTAKTREWRDQLRQCCRAGTELRRWDTQLKRIQDFFKSGIKQDDPITSIDTIRAKREEAAKLLSSKNALNEGMVSYEIQIHLWTRSDVSAEKPLRILRVPIATAHTYYGHLLVAYQQQREDCALFKKLEAELGKLARERYTPTLSLLHFSKWERELKQHLCNNRTRTLAGRAAITPLSLQWKDSADELERAFGDLWERRKKALRTDKRKDKRFAKARIKGSIILDSYHIASPSMVTEIHKVVRGASLMNAVGERKKSLPSALVFGEAGSGKDQMARLIPTLTEPFWDIEPVTQNMAAIKPALLAMPLMFGVAHNAFSTPGVFKSVSTKSKGKTQLQKQVLILDELNSLDYDMQGSLLRLIENNEVAPLFTHRPEPLNALVIGIVNEDPERVTREEELRLLEGAREFLGQAEAARLYEAFHRARRLRPDLVHRLRRGIYVRMPSLRDRREDLPLLFSHSCDGPVRDLASRAGKGAVQIACDLEAFDLLMRPDLQWPGNIRQLQAVAGKVANAAWDDFRNEKDPSKVTIGGVDHEIVPIRRSHVKAVLHDEFRKQFGAPDDF